MKISLSSVVAIATIGSAYGQCECVTDDDCNPTCVISSYLGTGTCQTVPTPSTPGPTSTPTKPPTPFPTPENTPCPPCTVPKTIPTKCEVEILIAMMDVAVSGNRKRAAQWLRAAFHDAGTHDQNVPEGGAKGCLMNHPPMLSQSENSFLDVPVGALRSIRNNWEGHPDTCIDISSADIIQFAGFFATVRQRGPVPGVLDAAKNDQLLNGFQWGRPDETSCDVVWTDNLPGFSKGKGTHIPVVQRCLMSGGEIKTKMMDRNGFTEDEAVALLGAHTIGLVRNTFGVGLAGPWVTNGDDNAAAAIFGGLANGPVFDNAYHDFLINTIVEDTAPDFAVNDAPFTRVFSDWFQDFPNGLDHLDTDIAIAFPSTDLGVHPHFNVHTETFAADNNEFLTAFDAAYDKMSKLGVTVPLQDALDCDPCELGGSPLIGSDEVFDDAAMLRASEVVIKLVSDLGFATANAEDVLDMKQASLSDLRVRQTTEFDLQDFPQTRS